MEQEIWKDISGYEGLYQVSNLGRVKSFKLNKEHFIKTTKNGNKYISITLFDINCNRKYFKVHRLVAEAFIPNPDNKPQVNHINGIKSDNRVENLEWCTSKENIQHSYDNAIQISRKGEINGSSKLTNKDVLNIVKLYNDGYTQEEIARLYDVNPSTISYIITGKHWSHITGIEYKPKKVKS